LYVYSIRAGVPEMVSENNERRLEADSDLQAPSAIHREISGGVSIFATRRVASC
jgi:hypothetical protein